MKLKKMIFLYLIKLSFNLNSAIGCMDRSFHMQRDGDMKEYHYVRCACPCKNVTGYRGKCIRCLHYGRPDRGEINALQLNDWVFN